MRRSPPVRQMGGFVRRRIGRTRPVASRGFTLIEIAMSVFILLLILLLAVPSLKGVLADRRARRSLNDLNNLVRQAQELSVTERRPYLLVWTSKGIVLRPETFAKGEEKAPVATMP